MWTAGSVLALRAGALSAGARIEAVVLALLALKHLPLQFRRERQRASADRASKGYVCDDLLLSPIGSGE